MPTPPLPEDWTCPVCRATHPQPVLRCRRCAAPLVQFARLAAAARALRLASRDQEAKALE